MLNIIIFGPPGAGKGTQAILAAQRNKLIHLASGELLRRERENGKIGEQIKKYQDSGRLVPDKLIIEIITKEILNNRSKKGFVFDGYPRNLRQARSLDFLLKSLGSQIDSVINLKINTKKAIKRILLRGQVSGRSDDHRQVLSSRFQVYHLKTKPLVVFYKKQNKLINIDGDLEIEAINEKIQDTLNKIKNTKR